nr:zinc-finger homeodomain protein 5-like [Ipomoea batatas]
MAVERGESNNEDGEMEMGPCPWEPTELFVQTEIEFLVLDLQHGGATNISPAAACGGGGVFKSKLSTTAGAPRARYRECLKNHAASIGGNVTDGCGEFMPSGEEGTLEALKCAACNCHRNFHRKERAGGGDGILVVHPLQLPGAPPMPSPSSINHHHHRNSPWGAPTSLAAQPVKMAFCSGGGGGSAATDSSSEELNFNAYQSSSAIPSQPGLILAKKRYRTKFSQDQKDKMLEFAEKLGWRIPREDDTQLQTFCAEVGVKRQVFKVWMHNNKNSAKKNTPQQEQDHQQPPGIAGI